MDTSGHSFPFIFHLSITRSTQFTQVRAPITSCENSSPFSLLFRGRLQRSRHISSVTMIKRLRAYRRYVTTTSAPPRLYQECMGVDKLPPRREEGCLSLWAPQPQPHVVGAPPGPHFCHSLGPEKYVAWEDPWNWSRMGNLAVLPCSEAQRAGKRNKTRASDGRQRKQTPDGVAVLFVVIESALEEWSLCIFQVRTIHVTSQTWTDVDMFFSRWWDSSCHEFRKPSIKQMSGPLLRCKEISISTTVGNDVTKKKSQMSWSVEAKSWNIGWNIYQLFIWSIHQIKCPWKTFGDGKQKFDRSDKTNVFKYD